MHLGRPSCAKASEGILLRGQAGCNPAKRLGAKQDGGEGRTRTCEAIRRLIYSQLPLPLGTLPRPTASANRPPEWRRAGPSKWRWARGTRKGGAVGRVYG